MVNKYYELLMVIDHWSINIFMSIKMGVQLRESFACQVLETKSELLVATWKMLSFKNFSTDLATILSTIRGFSVYSLAIQSQWEFVSLFRFWLMQHSTARRQCCVVEGEGGEPSAVCYRGRHMKLYTSATGLKTHSFHLLVDKSDINACCLKGSDSLRQL